MQTPLGIYISIPFCKAKCTFCNFASDAFAPGRMERYVDRLCLEIASAHASAATLDAHLPSTVDTIYLGGGTPSLLSPELVRQLFTRLRAHFDLAPDAEITLECAPGQLSGETLDELLHHGLNRVSLGVQSFIDRESIAIGRLHTRQICLAEIARLRAAGIHNLNLDLIAGLPHQTTLSWLDSLETAIATAVPHLSVYMLEIDEDSRLGRETLTHGSRYGVATLPSDDDTADWYQLACDRLNLAGLHQYEISNFARPGLCSRHNLKYWRRDPYLGFGLDAHSMLPTRTGAVRFSNTDDLDLYSADAKPSQSRQSEQTRKPSQSRHTENTRQPGPTRAEVNLEPPKPAFQIFSGSLPSVSAPLPSETLPAPQVDRVSLPQAFEESLFLGLRLNTGVSLAALRHHFGEALLGQTLPAIDELSDAGLLEQAAGDRITLTDRGRVLSNEVFSRLLLTPIPACACSSQDPSRKINLVPSGLVEPL